MDDLCYDSREGESRRPLLYAVLPELRVRSAHLTGTLTMEMEMEMEMEMRKEEEEEEEEEKRER
jgi:hypothetical protein